jgi:arylsulfatase A-like enzyme
LQLLDEKGIADNTIVVFTSDNGGVSGDRFRSTGSLRGRKGAYYEGGLRVPFVLRWPRKVQPGAHTDHVAAFWDVLPTFADVAGVNAREKTDGVSFLPALLGDKQRPHEYLYWELASKSSYQQAVRWNNWKGIRSVNYAKRSEPSYRPVLELYDLKSDPAETNNVVSQRRRIAAKIESIMDEAHEDMPGLELPEFSTRSKP